MRSWNTDSGIILSICEVVQDICPVVDIARDHCEATAPPERNEENHGLISNDNIIPTHTSEIKILLLKEIVVVGVYCANLV